MSELFDEQEVRRTLEVMVKPGSVWEVRALGAQLQGDRRTSTVFGYFNHREACVSGLKKFITFNGIYFIPNPVNRALLARCENRLDYAGKDSATGDQHILRRLNLIIDFDPVRPSGISASDEEKEAAHQKMLEVYKFLREFEWPEPIMADSGNGYHLRYGIDLPCNDGKIQEQVLALLAHRFDDERVKIDRSIHNPARIIKLYGTMVAKGDNTKERPHRPSKILYVPDELLIVTEEQLRALVEELKIAAPTAQEERPAAGSRSRGVFDVDAYLQRHALEAVNKFTRPDGTIVWQLAVCVFNPDHVATSVVVMQLPSGALVYKCSHRSCADKHWEDFRRHFEPDYDSPKVSVTNEPHKSFELPPPYVPPPLSLFPDEVQRFIRDGAATFDVDRAFFLLPVLSGAAAMIGNARSIQLKDDYIEPSIIWTVNIASTGDGKSPGLQASTAPLRMRECELIQKNKEAYKAYAGDLARWEAKSKKERAREEKPQKPPLLTCLMDDTTIEAVASRLNDNPRGVALVKDEFSHWFESMDQYHDRGGSDVSRWLSIWTGNLFALDRVTDGRSYRIPDPRCSITGGAVPDKFKRLLTVDFFVRGLPARFLLSMPTRNRPRRWVEGSIPPEVKAEVNELFAKLVALQPHTNKHGEESPVLLGLSAEAQKIFVDFYHECARRAFEADIREAAQWSKLSAYSARLALVGELLWDSKAREVSGNVMRAACELARWFGHEAERIYALIAETPEQRQQRKLVEFIEHRGGTVTERDVYTNYWALKSKLIETRAALATLVSAGRGKWGETKGERGPATREFQLLPTPTSAGFGVSPSKTPKPADADVPSMQKITSSDEPKKEPVSDEVKFQTLPASASAGFSNYLGKMPKPADTEAPKSQENAPSREENEPSSDPITEPVSDGPEFQLLQENEVPPDPAVFGDLSL